MCASSCRNVFLCHTVKRGAAAMTDYWADLPQLRADSGPRPNASQLRPIACSSPRFPVTSFHSIFRTDQQYVDAETAHRHLTGQQEGAEVARLRMLQRFGLDAGSNTPLYVTCRSIWLTAPLLQGFLYIILSCLRIRFSMGDFGGLVT